jgi:hypothetical protein
MGGDEGGPAEEAAGTNCYANSQRRRSSRNTRAACLHRGRCDELFHRLAKVKINNLTHNMTVKPTKKGVQHLQSLRLLHDGTTLA